MPAFSIYEKPNQPLEQTIDEAVMVAHRFSYLIFLVPAIWMLIKRLWLPLLAYILVSVGLALLDGLIPLWTSMLVSLIIAIWIAAEAPNLMGWALKRRGYEEVGLIYADNLEHCEARYIHARTHPADLMSTGSDGSGDPNNPNLLPWQEPKTPSVMPTQKDQDQPVIGLFPTSENA
ncbi:DUF2628 domain-containing protein [Cohaesibacter gelatinilyticus]|uniref:DUF2628 domain-containing protein n=1 Tax=Cohaesibacter gelatinilyticus TaxID=372072 RepID=A0A285PF99_9HYPH|nr:DUF2628 domain-containing protein [Cohaesibacter gelatinilyticus]SNZ19907.1 Protein of unknown function [Cohaesibacter gelatinilyticus]HAT86931.1 DUF2628 domain-containing protein [Hyphomicrobiales bacterium]